MAFNLLLPHAASWDWEIDLPGVVSAGLAAMEAVRSLTRTTSERCAALRCRLVVEVEQDAAGVEERINRALVFVVNW